MKFPTISILVASRFLFDTCFFAIIVLFSVAMLVFLMKMKKYSKIMLIFAR